MFERYTESARRLIFFSRYEAAQLGSPYIETEHILLGCFRDLKPLLARFAPGLTREQVERAIAATAPPVSALASTADLPLSDASKRVLAYAADEAGRLRSRTIIPEHLFVGLLREREHRAAQILSEAGVTLESAREKLPPPGNERAPGALYCPRCAREISDPLTCGDCSAVICPVCGTPLETSEELGIG